MNLRASQAEHIVGEPLISWFYLLRAAFAGILMPLSFAPFHFPGLAILGLAMLYAELQNKTIKQATKIGLVFGTSYMAVGVSWVYISIHLYGNLNIFMSVLITIIFIFYLAIFYILQAITFTYIQSNIRPLSKPSCRGNLLRRFGARILMYLRGHSGSALRVSSQFTSTAGFGKRSIQKIYKILSFAATWCLAEYLRANFATGFPWLMVGFGQVDSPLSGLLPYIGIYGVSFLVCIAACLVYYITNNKKHAFASIPYLVALMSILLAPNLLTNNSKSINESIPTGVIQANLSMREKWDNAIFSQITTRYQNGVNALKNKAQFIIMPESAIPVPKEYASEFINNINNLTKKYNNSILMGIPHPANKEETLYYNTATFFGGSKGSYYKQHLVPFGEYIPKPFQAITNALQIPDPSMASGKTKQELLTFKNHPFANLICFEVAYPEILRQQLPRAEWIVAISDVGWFGHSLAIYQQLQMSQALSAMTGRYQVVANNNGLSSIINNHGKIVNSLPAYTSKELYGHIQTANDATIWTIIGDMPYLYLCIVIIIIALVNKRGYPYRSTLSR